MKRFVVGAVLAFTAFWPLVHYGLVRALEINNWKLAGWAMYATPQSRVLTALFTEVEGGYAQIRTDNLPADVQREQRRFERWRQCLGTLIRPDDFGRAALAARPDVENVVVLVQRMYLEPHTALTGSTRAEYRYGRGALEN
jgi:hypothetical protein